MAAPKKKKTTTLSFTKYVLWFWRLIILGVIGSILLFLLASWGIFGEMPDHTILENPETNLATEIISADGVTIIEHQLIIKSYQSIW